jgi:hypothetical protein
VALPSTSISPPCRAAETPEVNHSGLECAEGLTGTLRIQGLKVTTKAIGRTGAAVPNRQI